MPRSDPPNDLTWPPAPDDLAVMDLGVPEEPPHATDHTRRAPSRRPTPATRDARPPASTRVERSTIPPRRTTGRTLLIAVACCCLLAAAALLVRTFWFGQPASPTTQDSLASSSPPLAASSPAAPATGSLTVRTEPPGAVVIVDNRRLGTSPVSVPAIEPGDHVVVIQHAGRTFRHDAHVAPGESVSLVVPLPPVPAPAPAAAARPAGAWIRVSAPFEVRVVFEGRLLGTSEMARIPLEAGTHAVQLVNEAVGYSGSQTIVVVPGQTTTIEVAVPQERVAINAIPWAEVSIDGRPVGQTPLGALTLPLGPHVIVLSHPRFGEKTIRTTIRAGEPARISVDMRQ